MGQGGFSTVYLAEHTRKPGVLAVAKLLNSGVNPQQVKHEADMQGAVDHPHVVKLYDSVVAEDPTQQSALIMEYAPWGNFKELLDPNGLPLDKVFPYLLQSLRGLMALHEAGISWNDAKPANNLLGLGGAKLSDFGIARKLGEKLTLVEGSPVYMAPEQFKLQGGTEKSDLHSMALTIYHLLTGTQPFEGTLPQIMALKGMGNQMLRPFIDEMGDRATPKHKAIADVLGTALEADAAKRPATVSEFTEEFVTKYHGAKDISYHDMKPKEASELDRPRDKDILEMIAELRAMQNNIPDKTIEDGVHRIEFQPKAQAVPEQKRGWKKKMAAFITTTTTAVSLGLGGLHVMKPAQEVSPEAVQGGIGIVQIDKREKPHLPRLIQKKAVPLSSEQKANL